MKPYEVMLVVTPDLPDDQVKKVVEAISNEIAKEGGQIGESTVSAKQRLPYRLAKRDDGYYATLKFQAQPSSIANLEERLRLNQGILRHLVMRSK
ncbi:MAG: 30S ribosomal protein S6 [Candidatus Aureabacteria bacterium]|nr:30S ribosomal protein S6 [Candidatus Auribacterota bacterium]